METLSQDDIGAIRSHLQRQHALGPDRFRLAIEAQLSRRAGPANIGRPHKPVAWQSALRPRFPAVRPTHFPPPYKSNDCK
jgi:hypothetical protein